MFLFPLSRTIDEVDRLCCISSHGEFLGIVRSNFSILPSTRRSPMQKQCGSIAALYLVTLDIYILGFVESSKYLLLF